MQHSTVFDVSAIAYRCNQLGRLVFFELVEFRCDACRLVQEVVGVAHLWEAVQEHGVYGLQVLGDLVMSLLLTHEVLLLH